MDISCERCHSREGSLTKTVGDKNRFLCETCARALGIFRSIGLRLPGTVEIASWTLIKENAVDDKCHHCGQTWFKIDMTGFCDCPECYKSFSRSINKIRSISSRQVKSKKDIIIEILQKKMQWSIDKEQFEKAAHLRDLVAQWKR